MVELSDMLAARDRRAARQTELLKEYRLPLICFTMNIAGPIKNSPLIERGFAHGNRLLRRQLARAGFNTVACDIRAEVTGCESFYVVEGDALALKRIAADVEDGAYEGRLFDIDVLGLDGVKLERTALGLPPRGCLICGGEAKTCARSRAHGLDELKRKTDSLLKEGVELSDAEDIAQNACRALLYEVCTTPKPGLVDAANSGSHKDMDIFTFMSSVAALTPYFERCARIGAATAKLEPQATFERLRLHGRLAEGAMLAATGGVNTHKGAVFTVGLVCASLGRLSREQWRQPDMVLRECAAMTAGLTERELSGVNAASARSAGERLYAKYGVTGVRGQAENGFPAVLNAGLPTLESAVEQGLSLNSAGCAALLKIICSSVDTNLISRGGKAAQERVAQEIAELLARDPYPDGATLSKLDGQFIQANLSPGGSADLLAISYMMFFIKRMD